MTISPNPHFQPVLKPAPGTARTVSALSTVRVFVRLGFCVLATSAVLSGRALIRDKALLVLPLLGDCLVAHTMT